ncbi:hypothetical protein SOVF_124780 [Spinacia oleracea]|nr:hypothetical protein SOVF_124780 [Spinacia oleracea]
MNTKQRRNSNNKDNMEKQQNARNNIHYHILIFLRGSGTGRGSNINVFSSSMVGSNDDTYPRGYRKDHAIG